MPGNDEELEAPNLEDLGAAPTGKTARDEPQVDEPDDEVEDPNLEDLGVAPTGKTRRDEPKIEEPDSEPGREQDSEPSE